MRIVQFFFMGVISSLGALFLELSFEIFLSPASFDTLTIPNNVNFFLILAVLIEEGTKYAVLRARFQALPSSKKIFPFPIAFAAGFGFTESALVFFTVPVVFYSTLLVTFMLHLITVGWAYAFLRFLPSCRSWIIPTFAIMTIIHLGYNSLVVYNFGIGTLCVYLFCWSAALFLLARYLWNTRASYIS